LIRLLLRIPDFRMLGWLTFASGRALRLTPIDPLPAAALPAKAGTQLQ
jgi:hypothetical protein